MPIVYLGLGSNLGDREGNIKRALELLSQKVKIEKLSSLYETEPMGYLSQPLFLNAVCQALTELSPEELLEFVKEIERRIGREPSFPNAPRPIDIDILFYEGEIINLPHLIIPHPRLKERAFVLVPLAEISPHFIHPQGGERIIDLLNKVEQKGVKKWSR